MECVPVLRSTARDVGYTLPAAFLQKYRRFEATFKDVNTMVDKGPLFGLPRDARELAYLPPRMAEAMRRLCKPPARGTALLAPPPGSTSCDAAVV